MMEDQLASFLRSFFGELEEDELLEEDEEERRFLDFPLCFFTFLHYVASTFSSSRSRTTRRTTKMKQTGFCVFFF
jgi:hypothetical protein